MWPRKKKKIEKKNVTLSLRPVILQQGVFLGYKDSDACHAVAKYLEKVLCVIT